MVDDGDRSPLEHPAERYDDRRWPVRALLFLGRLLRPRENWYRDIALVGLAIVLLWTALKTPVAVDNARRAVTNSNVAVRRQAEGRKAAIQIICGVASAIIDAGRATIVGSEGQGVPRRLALNLERLGYPPKHVREKQARRAARSYAQSIAERVREVADGKATGVVRNDGSLNCRRLLVVSNVP